MELFVLYTLCGILAGTSLMLWIRWSFSTIEKESSEYRVEMWSSRCDALRAALKSTEDELHELKCRLGVFAHNVVGDYAWEPEEDDD